MLLLPKAQIHMIHESHDICKMAVGDYVWFLRNYNLGFAATLRYCSYYLGTSTHQISQRPRSPFERYAHFNLCPILKEKHVCIKHEIAIMIVNVLSSTDHRFHINYWAGRSLIDYIGLNKSCNPFMTQINSIQKLSHNVSKRNYGKKRNILLISQIHNSFL